MLTALFLFACMSTPADLPQEIPPSRVEPPTVPTPPIQAVPTPSGRLVLPDDPDDPAQIQHTIRRYSGQVKYCYERRLKGVPDLSGRIEVSWSLSEKGRVTDTKVVSNDTGDEELATCLLARLQRWRFPNGASRDVSWPFVFRPNR